MCRGRRCRYAAASSRPEAAQRFRRPLCCRHRRLLEKPSSAAPSLCGAAPMPPLANKTCENRCSSWLTPLNEAHMVGAPPQSAMILSGNTGSSAR